MLLGIDIGGTKCAVILAQADGTPEQRVARSTGSVDEMLEYFCREGKRFQTEYKIDAVGISCGGPLNEQEGLILSPPNLPGWDNIPICRILQEALGVPAFLCNDANACALAEWQYGAGVGTKNMIFLTFGTGLGAGLILDGRLYSGTTGMAGEAGHIRLAETGPVGYGKAGSFEGFCSGGGIARLAQYMARGKQVSYGADATAKSLAALADAGDRDALAVYEESARRLGRGLAILTDLLDPERIVIGSVFARSEHLFREIMEKTRREEALPTACTVVPAKLGDRIGDYAAIAVAKIGLEKQI